ncbi:MAG: hypothetical protein ACFFEV_05060 [Candidatus Thorarchaeota archaeon]
MTKEPKVYHLDSYFDNMYTLDVYITGSLETEPEFIEFQNLRWQKKPQSKFSEDGIDSFVFQATHPRGFNLIVYPYKMVEKTSGGWEYIVFLKGWEREWNYWEERDDTNHIASYIATMKLAVRKADNWKVNPNHPEFPVNK